MTICCGDTIDGLYTARITSSDGESYNFQVENPTLDPTIIGFQNRAGSRANSKQRKRSTMSMTLTILDDVDTRLEGPGTVIKENRVFKPILGQCGLTVQLVSECGSNVFVMTRATEESGSSINLSEGTVDVVFSSSNEVRCERIDTNNLAVA